MDDLSRVDLNWLHALGHLLDARSVTEAARRAGVGQPAMSRTLAHLRALLDDPLLVRAGRAWELSERARALHPRVQSALAAIRDALRPPAPFDAESTRFEARIAANDYAGATLLLPWLVVARKHAPGLSVSMEPIAIHTIASLEEGEIDLAIGPRIDSPHLGLDRFVVRPIWEDHFVCVMRKNHPCTRSRWDLEAFVSCEHLMITTGRPGPAAVDAALAQLGHRRNVVAKMSSFLLALALVARSNLIATLPSRLFAVTTSTLARRDPPLTLPPLPLYLAWHPRSTNDPRHRWIRESLLAHGRGQ